MHPSPLPVSPPQSSPLNLSLPPSPVQSSPTSPSSARIAVFSPSISSSAPALPQREKQHLVQPQQQREP